MKNPTYSQAFAQGVSEEMRRDPSIFVMGTDMTERGGSFAQLVGVGQEFGSERVRDTPISEAAMVAAGVGAAMNGMRPIVDMSFVDFSLSAMDEIANQVAKMRYMLRVPMPIVIRATTGIALYGMQHNNSLETWFAHMPGLLVAMPSSPGDVKGMIKTALRGDDPVVFLMHKRLGGRRGEVGDEETLVPFGRANLVRSGLDVTLVTYSEMVARSLEAAKLLAEEGIEVEVIDLRTLMPLDLETIETSVQRTRRLVIVGESPRFLGIGSEIAAAIQETLFRELAAPIQRVGAPHVPIPASPPLYQAMSPQVADIARAVRKAMTS